MRIALGADHAGFMLKQELSGELRGQGHELLDLGTSSTDPVDYPDFAQAVGLAVVDGRAAGLKLLAAAIDSAVA